MKKLLYVDSCIHRGTSRTERLAQALFDRFMADALQVIREAEL